MPCRVVIPLTAGRRVVIFPSENEETNKVYVKVAHSIPSIRRRVVQEFSILGDSFKISTKHDFEQVMKAAHLFQEFKAKRMIRLTRNEDGSIHIEVDTEDQNHPRMIFVNSYDSQVFLDEFDIEKLYDRKNEILRYFDTGLDLSDCSCDIVSEFFAYDCLSSQID